MELSAFAKTNTAARLRAAASRGALSHALILSGAGDRNAAAHYAAARAAFLLKLETAKATREELAALFEGTRVILADALCTLCGAPPAEPRDEQALRAVLGSRLTKAQILGTIELLETYRNHCEYNVGVGPLLGGLAVELEEIL